MEIFNNLCRSCNVEKQNLLNIHNHKEFSNSVSIKEMLEFCLQTTITDECKYPKVICYDCVKQLEISYRFFKRFYLAQSEFEETYNRLEKLSEDISGSCTAGGANVETICEEMEERSNNTTCEDLVNRTKHVVEVINIKPFENRLQNKAKNTIKQHGAKALTSSPIVNVAPSSNSLPAIICSHCNKTFFTTKALNLHQKLSHKRKI